MSFPIRVILIISALLQLFIFQASGQNGTIKGTVKDKETGEELVGASVFVKGTTIGVSSDLDGKFELANIQTGTYTVVCSYISYRQVEFENIAITPGKVVSLEVILESDASFIEGVTVVARRSTSTDLALLSSIKTAEVVVSGISAQQIKQSQDRDAAQVLKRVPGVTIVEGRFINIRGLNERYNVTLLHDVNAPSMEADVKSFSFDIIQSSLIDRILIYKSPSAELPGNFGGGVVKIYTKSIPDENSTTVSFNPEFVEGVSFNSFYRAPQGNGYWTGFNNGHYDLPSGFPSNLRAIDNNPLQVAEVGKTLRNSWVPEDRNALWNNSGSINVNRRFKIRNAYIGSITSLNYSNRKMVNDIERQDFNAYDFETETSSRLFSFNDQRSLQSIRFGALFNWAAILNQNNTIEFKNLFNQLSQSEYIYRTGNHFDFGYYADNHSFYQIYRGIYSGQLTGLHTLSEKSKLDWVVGYGYSYRDEPDYRRYRSDLDTITRDLTLYIPAGAAATYFMGRFYSEMREHTFSGSSNYSYKFNLFNSKPVLNSGLWAEYTDRKFSSRNLGYVWADLLNFDPGLLDVTIDSLFHPDNINPATGIKIDEQTNPSDSYSATNTNLSGYAALFFPVSPKLNITGGLRLENNLQTLSSSTLTNDPINAEVIDVSWLPSVNVSYNFTEKMLVRAAYGKTVNRPEFRELAPFGFYDFNFNLVKKGSDTLKIAYIHNYEVRWEYYPTGTEIITVGVFYKRFLNPIETSFVPGGGSGGIKTFTYANADKAASIGVEAEIRKSLRGLTGNPFINNLSILFNGALIQSSVELGGAGLGQKETSRPMYGQSPYIVNAGLYYHSIESRLHVSLLYNVIGKRIYVIGFEDYPDIYEMPRNMLDLTITKDFGKRWEIKAGITNILATDWILLQDGNQDEVFDVDTDQVIQSYHIPRAYTIGATFKF